MIQNLTFLKFLYSVFGISYLLAHFFGCSVVNIHKGEHTQCPVNNWSEELFTGLSLLTQAMTLTCVFFILLSVGV